MIQLYIKSLRHYLVKEGEQYKDNRRTIANNQKRWENHICMSPSFDQMQITHHMAY